MIREDFSIGSSLLHRIDPRVKIIIAVCFAVQTAMHHTLSGACLSLVLGVCLILFSTISPAAILKRLILVNSFTLFIWLTLPFTYQGTPIAHIGSFDISREGIFLALLLTIKTNAALTGIIALLATSTPAAIGHGLEKLHLPTRLCFILLFAYRYIFVIYDEYKTLLRAARMRCFVPKSTMHTYRTFAYLFGMTLVRSHNRSSRIHQAMMLRGFDDKLIPLKAKVLDRKDFLFFLVCITTITFIGISSYLQLFTGL